jgi:hypothetical protein
MQLSYQWGTATVRPGRAATSPVPADLLHGLQPLYQQHYPVRPLFVGLHDTPAVRTSGMCSRHGTAGASYVTKQNLVVAVNPDQQPLPHGRHADQPNNYLLTFVGSGTEMLAPSGTSGWIGSRIWEVMALTKY